MTKAFLTRRTAMLATATTALAAAASPHFAFAQDAPEPAGTVDMEKLLEPGALEEIFLGADDAPITVVEYASMTCGHCANFHINTWPTIEKNYVETGKVRFILREFPFDPRAAAAFMLARCAPGGKYFPMVDVLFKQQDVWARAENARQPLENIAKLAGFTQESFQACLTDQKLLDDINTVRERGSSEFGVNATPTFFINGKKYSGALTVEQMSAIFDALL
jgi:protein-disulfide isomerase